MCGDRPKQIAQHVWATRRRHERPRPQHRKIIALNDHFNDCACIGGIGLLEPRHVGLRHAESVVTVLIVHVPGPYMAVVRPELRASPRGWYFDDLVFLKAGVFDGHEAVQGIYKGYRALARMLFQK